MRGMSLPDPKPTTLSRARLLREENASQAKHSFQQERCVPKVRDLQCFTALQASQAHPTRRRPAQERTGSCEFWHPLRHSSGWNAASGRASCLVIGGSAFHNMPQPQTLKLVKIHCPCKHSAASPRFLCRHETIVGSSEPYKRPLAM